MKKFTVLALVLFTVFSGKLFAQETGLTNQALEFNGSARDLYFYVPENYSADTEYKMIVCLHGAGDTAENFATALSDIWKDLAGSPILMFPDGGDDESADFFTPQGDEQFITDAIAYALETYNIDENEIVLEGFSLGGRSAFKYGSEHSDVFKGLMLHTPAFQGVKDATNEWGWFDLTDASNLPMVFVHGSEDIAYVSTVRIMYENIVEAGGIAIRHFVQDMGHTIPANIEITEQYLSYFDNPYSSTPSAEIYDIEDPGTLREADQTLEIRFRNRHSENISEIKFNMDIDGETSEFTWTGDLAPYKSDIFKFSGIKLKEGSNPVSFTITEVDGQTEGFLIGSEFATQLIFQENAFGAGFTYGFENTDPQGLYWKVEPSGALFTWDITNMAAKSDASSLFMLNTPLYFDNEGLTESLYTPYFDLSGMSNPELEFAIAANYLLYDQSVTGQTEDLIFADTLSVLISVDGGDTFETLYSKDATEFATSDSPIKNALDLNSAIFLPAAGQWGIISLPLSEYADEENVIFRIDYTSGMGGSIFLDEFKMTDEAQGVEEQADTPALTTYPNPAKDILNIDFNAPILGISVYSVASGKLVKEFINPTSNQINVEDLNSGMYFIQISTPSGIRTGKFSVIE